MSADISSLPAYDEIWVPSDIQEFGERHGIPTFADATYRNGYMAGAKEAADRIASLEAALAQRDKCIAQLKAAGYGKPIIRRVERAPLVFDDSTDAASCWHCHGTGRHEGKFAGPGWPLCGHCGGTGRAASLSSSKQKDGE